MNKLLIMLLSISVTGCALSWEGGYRVVPDETDDTMITYEFDPAFVDMKMMKREANAYCKEKGYRKADTAVAQGNFWTFSQMVYECEP